MEYNMYTALHCTVVGSLYVEAENKGYDLADFVEKTMISDLGVFLYDPIRMNVWTCARYIMDWFEQQMTFLPKQREYQSNPEFVGYLYRYWMLTRDLTSREVYALAPFNIVDFMYTRLELTAWEGAIEDLMEIHNGEITVTPDFQYTCTNDPVAVRQLKGVYDLFGGSLI